MHDEGVLEEIDRILEQEEFAPLFGSSRRLLRIVRGLVPHQKLTSDSLNFHPADMARWIRDGEETARRVISESPFA